MQSGYEEQSGWEIWSINTRTEAHAALRRIRWDGNGTHTLWSGVMKIRGIDSSLLFGKHARGLARDDDDGV
jgi:hypothetical protein